MTRQTELGEHIDINGVKYKKVDENKEYKWEILNLDGCWNNSFCPGDDDEVMFDYDDSNDNSKVKILAYTDIKGATFIYRRTELK